MFRALISAWRHRPLVPWMALGAAAAFTAAPVRAQALFDAGDLVQERFVLVAAPIGTSSRYQLNIYEQINDRRPCYAYGAGLPVAVNPLLATFDFTGICNRYIDANGYSLRIGGTDLATLYRLTVRNDGGGTLLIASPVKQNAGPEMVIARSGGPINGFHRLQFEPGWKLMRRQFGGRRLGHVYVYSEAWPGGSGGAPTAAVPAVPPSSSTPPTTAPATPRASVSPGVSAKPAATPGGSGSQIQAPPPPSAQGSAGAAASARPAPQAASTKH